jgi:hypothetical protein
MFMFQNISLKPLIIFIFISITIGLLFEQAAILSSGLNYSSTEYIEKEVKFCPNSFTYNESTDECISPAIPAHRSMQTIILTYYGGSLNSTNISSGIVRSQMIPTGPIVVDEKGYFYFELPPSEPGSFATQARLNYTLVTPSVNGNIHEISDSAWGTATISQDMNSSISYGITDSSGSLNLPISAINKLNIRMHEFLRLYRLGYRNTTPSVSEIQNLSLNYSYKPGEYNFVGPSNVTYISDSRDSSSINNIIKSGETYVNLYKNDSIVAKIKVWIYSNIDWSAGIVNVSEDGTKSLFHYPGGYNNLPGRDPHDRGFLLYVSKVNAHDKIRICPNASTFEEITLDCGNGYDRSIEDSDVSIVTIDNKSYWRISGITGTGAMGYSTNDSSNNNQNPTNPPVLTTTGSNILIGFTPILLFGMYQISKKYLINN